MVHLWSSQDWVCSDQRLSQAKLKVEIDNATPIVWVENGASEGKTKIDKGHDFDNTICHARTMQQACGMLVRCRGFVEKKIIWRKTIVIHNVFKEKTTKLNS
jgi:hypothetical protein